MKDLQGEASITQEHVENNAAVRKMLTERGIIPENLPPAEDVKKVERRLESEKKKLLKGKKWGDEIIPQPGRNIPSTEWILSLKL